MFRLAAWHPRYGRHRVAFYHPMLKPAQMPAERGVGASGSYLPAKAQTVL